MANSGNQNLGLLVLRLGFSGLMLTHGIPKLMKLFRGDFSFPNPIGVGEEVSLILAVLAEFLCPVLVILGIRTRVAAIPVVITMLVAAFIVHGADPFGKKEFALLYALGFLVIAIAGPGKYTLRKLI